MVQKEALQLEQAHALIMANDQSQAYDVLSEMLTRKLDGGTEFLAHAYCGLIRHSQWASAVRASSLQSKGKPGAVLHILDRNHCRHFITNVKSFVPQYMA